MVPIPEKKSVVVGEKPVMIGTKKVAPNIAAICCKPTPMVRGHVRRSSVDTTSPEETLFPLPCNFHESRDIFSFQSRSTSQKIPRIDLLVVGKVGIRVSLATLIPVRTPRSSEGLTRGLNRGYQGHLFQGCFQLARWESIDLNSASIYRMDI